MTSSRQKSEPLSIAFTTRTNSGRSSSSPPWRWSPSALLMGFVPPVEDHRVLVGIEEDSHLADPGVAEAGALQALRLELGLCGVHVRHPQREAADVRREVDVLLLRLPEGERDLAGRQLVGAVRVRLEAEGAAG